jgi:hypothetical protein
MNHKEPRAMREIHEIRLQLYKEKKGLSDIEKAKKTNQDAHDILRKYKSGIKLLHRARAAPIQ